MKTLTKISALLVVIFAYHFLQAQQMVSEHWQDNQGSQAFFQKSVVRTDASGNTHIAGATLNQNGNYDLYLAKYNASGVLLWDVVYAGAGGWHDAATDLRVDASGNVYVTGSVFTSSNDSNDVVTLKYNASGVLQWDEIYNGSSSLNDGGTSLQLDASGNVYVSAFTQDANNGSDFLLLKYNNSGSLLLNQQFDLNNVHDVPVSLMVTSTRLAIAGATQVGVTDWDYLYVAYHPVNGSYISHSTSTGGTAGFDKVHDLQTDASGNFYLTGTVFNASTGYDILTVKLDDNLNVIWSANYNSTSTMNDVGNALAVDNAGNVMVTGFSETSTEGTNYVTIQYNSSGTQQWVKTFNGEGNAADTARAIAIDANDNIYITGSSFNGSTEDFYTTKYKSNGTELWGIAFNSLYNGSDRAFDIALDSLGGVLVSGQSQTQTGFEYATVKYIEKNVTLVQDTVLAPASWSFTANLGQLIDTDTLVAEDVLFYTQQSNPALYFQNDRFNYVWAKLDTSGSGNDTLHRVDMYFYNANTTKARAHNKQAFYTNYFLGYIPEHRAKVPHYDNLYYNNVWDNIDMQCGSDPKGFKYFIVVKPNGDPADIEFRYSGQNSLAIDGNGNLLIISSIDTLVQPEPTAWEIDANGNVTMLNWTASYSINGSNVTLSLGGSYTSTKTLVLGVGWEAYQTGGIASNGNLWWSTFYGGNESDWGLDVVTDNSNNSYMVGKTMSSDFPITTGLNVMPFGGQTDGFMVKFNNQAVRQWATYYGGMQYDAVQGIVYNQMADPMLGQIYIVGTTASNDLKIVPNLNPLDGTYYKSDFSGNHDAFIARFDNGGYLKWSAYVGGSAYDEGLSITADHTGNVYITGNTFSTTAQANSCLGTTGTQFPLCDPGNGAYYQNFNAGGQDVFITGFDFSNNLRWSTFYGSNVDDRVYEIHFSKGVGDSGNDHVYIVGHTEKTSPSGTYNGSVPGNGAFPLCDLPGSNDFFQIGRDGFISRFHISGTLDWATNMNNINGFHTVTSHGEYVYVGGFANTSGVSSCSPSANNVPVCNVQGGFYETTGNMYLAKFKTAGAELKWSTLYKGYADIINSTYLNSVFMQGAPYRKILDAATDASGNLYVIGSNMGYDFVPQASTPSGMYYKSSYNGGQYDDLAEVVLLSFDSDNYRVWASYFGTNAGNNSTPFTHPLYVDMGAAITVFETKDLYIVGYAGNLNAGFPFENPGPQPSGNPYFQTQDINQPMPLWNAFISRFDLESIGVGVSEEKAETISLKGINIFPNPSFGLLNIHFQENAEGYINLLDSRGTLVKQWKINAAKEQIMQVDIETFSPGIYLIQLQTEKDSQTAKFIKQ